MTTPVLGIQPPRFRRADPSANIPFIQVWQRPFWFTYYLVIDGQRAKLFSKFTLWPDRHSWKRAVNLAARLDRLLEDMYQRGLDRGMHPDDHLIEPEVHRDGGVPYLIHLYPFFLRRLGKNYWLLAYQGWVAELRLRKSGVEVEVKGRTSPAETAPALSGSRALAVIPPTRRAA